jgi:hypothetical protein
LAVFPAKPAYFMLFSALSHRGRLRLVDLSPTGRRVGLSPYGFRLVELRAYSSERPEAACSAVRFFFKMASDFMKLHTRGLRVKGLRIKDKGERIKVKGEGIEERFAC